MTEITITIPDALMNKLRPYMRELPLVLALGIEQLNQSVPAEIHSERARILRLLTNLGVAQPLDKNLLPSGVIDAVRQKPLIVSGKPVSEIIIEQRGPR